MPTTKTPKAPVDRAALARRIFDAAICNPSCELQDAVDNWLTLIEGVGAYIAGSAVKDGLDSAWNIGAYAPEIATLGSVIERSAVIARELAEAAIQEARA